MRWWFAGGILIGLLTGCEQSISTGTTGPSSDRPSIVNACAERPRRFASAPQPTYHAPAPAPVVNVNVPRPEPTIQCNRGGAGVTE